MQNIPKTAIEITDALRKVVSTVLGEPSPSNNSVATDEELHEIVARSRETLGFERDLPLRPRESN